MKISNVFHLHFFGSYSQAPDMAHLSRERPIQQRHDSPNGSLEVEEFSLIRIYFLCFRTRIMMIHKMNLNQIRIQHK